MHSAARAPGRSSCRLPPDAALCQCARSALCRSSAAKGVASSTPRMLMPSTLLTDARLFSERMNLRMDISACFSHRTM